ncbi:MAG TPA: GNAT family N-acetyltransferase [Terriglobales bacterium]
MTASETESMIALRDFVDLDLARRLEMAETLTPEYVQALQRFTPAATSKVIAGGTAVFGGTTYPANHIVGMGLYGPVTCADLEDVEEFYRSKGVPCEIVISPLSDRSLLDSLAPRGYRVTEFNSVLIRRLEAGKLIEPSEGITIERVTATTAKLWDSVIVTGYAALSPLPENLFVPFATLQGSTNFLARVDGVPAGGSMGAILRDAGIAALFGTATLPEFRGRGVQTALINRRLWEAANAACEYAVVSTLPGSASQRNMERRGFRVAYTKLVMVRTWPELTPSGADDGH